MDTPKPPGADLHSDDTEARRIAASLMGKARSERKAEAARANAAKRRGKPLSEEHKEKIRAANAARWAEKRSDLGLPDEPQEKRPPGRPRTRPVAEDTPKRPRGRPRKQTQEGSQE